MNYKAALLSVALAFGMMSVAYAQGSSPSAQQPDPNAKSPATQSPSSPSSAQPEQQPETSAGSPASSESSMTSFTGSIVKSGGKYMLHSATADYQLDDQKQAKKFEGKDVKVIGQLDSSTNTIRVQNIEPASM